LGDVRARREVRYLMDKEMMVTILLALLVVTSAVQAVQLNEVKEKIERGFVARAAITPTSASSSVDSQSKILSSSKPRPAPAQKPPRMVGGC
jgi:hypothetical protein